MLRKAFFEEYKLTPAIILDKVYKQPFPNRFLASLSPFLLKHIEEPTIYKLVSECFHSFFVRNVMQYEYEKYPVHLVGSIAWHYQDLLRTVAKALNIRIGTISQSPLAGLIAYHTSTFE